MQKALAKNTGTSEDVPLKRVRALANVRLGAQLAELNNTRDNYLESRRADVAVLRNY